MKPRDSTRCTHDEKDKWLYRDITEKIIGAALEVHKVLGNGFLESVCQQALCHELNLRSIKFESQKEIKSYFWIN